MVDLTRHLRAESGVWWGQASAEPTPLVHALLDQAARIGPLRAFVGISWDERLVDDLPAGLSIVSFGALGELRQLSKAGRLDVIPCHFSALPRMFAQRRLPQDVGLVQVSAPDASGRCSLGVGVDYVADAIDYTRVLIAEVNHRMPPTAGSTRIPLARFARYVETDRPLLEAPHRQPTEVDNAIAHHVATLVDNGDTIQVGVGIIPSAVLSALSGHQDLGLHSGIIVDGVLDLFDTGVMTGAGKEIDTGFLVAGTGLGSHRLYDRLGELPVQFRPASYTHHPQVLARLRRLVSINSALEVDLSGQVGAEVRDGAYVGAIGGQTDFSRAASLTGARSIIAVRASWRGRSAITPSLSSPVTTARSDVDVVATEYGVAHLRGCSVAERARRLVAIAAPQYRDELERTLRRWPGVTAPP